MTTDATTPTQTTDRELWILAGRLHEAYQQAEPGHRLYAAAQAADEWAHERYEASIELLRQHREQEEEIQRLRGLEARLRRAIATRDRTIGRLREQINTTERMLLDADMKLLERREAGREERVSGLHETLAALEWSGREEVDRGDQRVIVAACPRCRGLSPAERGIWADGLALQWGHRHDCALKAALEGREEEPEKVVAGSFTVHFDANELTGRFAELLSDLAEPEDDSEDRAAALADRVMVAEWERQKAQVQVEELLAKMEDGAAAMDDATSLLNEQGAEIRRLRDRIAELEAQVPEWQEAVDEASAEAQNYHRLYADQVGENMRLEARLADYDHQAEQAETYRRLYAQTLKCLQDYALTLESAVSLLRQDLGQPEAEPPVEVEWADYITLKWGTLKGWRVSSPAAQEALRKYHDLGVSLSVAMQHDTAEQKRLLCTIIDEADVDEVMLDWEGKAVSKEEAKRYVMEYGQARGEDA